MKTANQELIEDVCAASAAYLVNVMPALAGLETCELFKRLVTHFEAALRAYRDGLRSNIPEPSEN
jgi:hypothetical protein